MRRTLRLLAPYFAVCVFWCGLSNAWLTILAYHLQVLFWLRFGAVKTRRPVGKRGLLLALPAAMAGPLLYWLLPFMTRADLSSWLANHGLSGLSLAAMIPYFGLVHPVLEQVHWDSLRGSTPAAHIVFAGYHVIVLSSLLSVSWLIACFVALTTMSFAWRRMTERSGGILAPVVSHVLADLGIVVVAWLRT